MPVPDGPQFIKVFHSSRIADPPHEVEHPDPAWLIRRAEINTRPSNQHPDIIHAGEEKAAREVGGGVRPFIHEYEIDSKEVFPITYGDEVESIDPDYETPGFEEKMRGVQPGLFETVPGTPDIALKSNRAVPYRNLVEGEGTISYMIPKGAIGKSVRYVGVKER